MKQRDRQAEILLCVFWYEFKRVYRSRKITIIIFFVSLIFAIQTLRFLGDTPVEELRYYLHNTLVYTTFTYPLLVSLSLLPRSFSSDRVRGIVSALLVTPAKPWVIVMGKAMAISAFSVVATLLLNMVIVAPYMSMVRSVELIASLVLLLPFSVSLTYFSGLLWMVCRRAAVAASITSTIQGSAILAFSLVLPRLDVRLELGYLFLLMNIALTLVLTVLSLFASVAYLRREKVSGAVW